MSDIAKKVLLSIVLSIPSAPVGVILREVFQAWGIFDSFSERLGDWLKMHVTSAQVEWTIASIVSLTAYAALLWIVWRHYRIPQLADAAREAVVPSDTTENDRRALIAQARDFVSRTVRQNPDDTYFQNRL